MAVAKPQLAIAGLKTQEEAAAEAADCAMRRDRRGVLRARAMAAIGRLARERQFAVCAEELDADDKAFGGGKGVGASTLRACVEGTERNYFRLDWLFWFLEESDELASVLMEAIGLPQKDPKEELQDLRDIVRAELPKQAERMIRKAAEPRRR